MADTRYIYSGPLTGITIPDPDATKKPREEILSNGKVVTLPADNKIVKRLIALGRLKEESESQVSQTSQTSQTSQSAIDTPANPKTSTTDTAQNSGKEAPIVS